MVLTSCFSTDFQVAASHLDTVLDKLKHILDNVGHSIFQRYIQGLQASFFISSFASYYRILGDLNCPCYTFCIHVSDKSIVDVKFLPLHLFIAGDKITGKRWIYYSEIMVGSLPLRLYESTFDALEKFRLQHVRRDGSVV